MAEKSHVSGLYRFNALALTIQHIWNLDGHQTLIIPHVLGHNVVEYHAMSDRVRMTLKVDTLRMHVVVAAMDKLSRCQAYEFQILPTCF